MLVVALLTACGATEHVQVSPTQFIATVSPREEIVYLVPSRTEPPSPTPDLTTINLETPTPFVPTPVPQLVPAPPPSARAASADVPDYIPPSFIESWRECLSSPDRYRLQDLVWLGSLQGGYPDGWDYDEAMTLFGHEGGNDLCQFNTKGSGACGFVQLLPCPPDGLTFEGQFRGAMAKFQDGRRRFPDRSGFWAHWYQFHSP